MRETHRSRVNHTKTANQKIGVNHNRKAVQIETASYEVKENQVASAKPSRIRNLVEIYYDVQDVRIRSFNRLRQVGEVKGVNPNILKELEKQIKDYIEVAVRDEPIVKTFLNTIRGLGPILTGGLLSYFDVTKADHASGFWKYAGLHVVDGKAPKRQRGQKLEFNPRARTLCWKISDSFLKHRTPFYRNLYDEAKPKENKKLNSPLKVVNHAWKIDDPTRCPMYEQCTEKIKQKAKRTGQTDKVPACRRHIDLRAKRKMIKRFLLDFWLAWRKVEGLPTSEPYAIAILGHDKVEGVVEAEAVVEKAEAIRERS